MVNHIKSLKRQLRNSGKLQNNKLMVQCQFQSVVWLPKKQKISSIIKIFMTFWNKILCMVKILFYIIMTRIFSMSWKFLLTLVLELHDFF